MVGSCVFFAPTQKVRQVKRKIFGRQLGTNTLPDLAYPLNFLLVFFLHVAFEPATGWCLSLRHTCLHACVRAHAGVRACACVLVCVCVPWTFVAIAQAMADRSNGGVSVACLAISFVVRRLDLRPSWLAASAFDSLRWTPAFPGTGVGGLDASAPPI